MGFQKAANRRKLKGSSDKKQANTRPKKIFSFLPVPCPFLHFAEKTLSRFFVIPAFKI
jgi:hypothetical protein